MSVIEGINAKYYKKLVFENFSFLYFCRCHLVVVAVIYLLSLRVTYFFLLLYTIFNKKKNFFLILFPFSFFFFVFYFFMISLSFFFSFPQEYYLLLRHASCISKKHLGRKFSGSWINAGRIDVDGIHKWLFVNIKWYLSRAFMQKMLAAGDSMWPGIFKVHKL